MKKKKTFGFCWCRWEGSPLRIGNLNFKALFCEIICLIVSDYCANGFLMYAMLLGLLSLGDFLLHEFKVLNYKWECAWWIW